MKINNLRIHSLSQEIDFNLDEAACKVSVSTTSDNAEKVSLIFLDDDSSLPNFAKVVNSEDLHCSMILDFGPSVEESKKTMTINSRMSISKDSINAFPTKTFTKFDINRLYSADPRTAMLLGPANGKYEFPMNFAIFSENLEHYYAELKKFRL